MRSKTRYICGQTRGGIKGKAVDSVCPPGRAPKDYHRQSVLFHGGEMAYEAYVKGGRKGYGR
jgi:hypothetical protein